jgi:predicted phosphodiesterase
LSILKVAVISDLHCRHSGGKSPVQANTFLTSDLFPLPVNRNPVESLKKVIRERSIVADLLVCPGDITDKCDPQGLITGWRFLEELASAFKAQQLVATVGNHDVDSRHLLVPFTHSFDLIQRLNNFPTSNAIENDKFWSKHYCILETDESLLVVLNSCFTHTDITSAKFSKIDQSMIDRIREDVTARRHENKCKLALVHHHPMLHSNIDYSDTDFLDKSDELLKLLDELDFHLCIHGHKHDPRLVYKNSLAVLAAGSLSSTMNILDLKADNVFHHITITIPERRGIIESWIYSPKDGWKQQNDTYFPCLTGFGFQTNIKTLATEVAAFFNSRGKEVLSYSIIVQQFPNLAFLIPDDQTKLNNYLLSEHGIHLMPKLPNIPQVAAKLYM